MGLRSTSSSVEGVALTSAFITFSAVRALPAYAAKSPRKVPVTGLKVPEKSPENPTRRAPDLGFVAPSITVPIRPDRRPSQGCIKSIP